MKPIKLTRNHLAVAAATNSWEGETNGLNCVHVEEGRLVAADGHMCVVADVETAGVETPFLVPRKTFMGVDPIEDEVELRENGSIRVTNDAGHQEINNGTVDAKYPNVDPILERPEGQQPAIRIALAPAVLRKVLDSVGDTNQVVFYFYEPLTQVFFEANTPEKHRGAFMPMTSSPEKE
ncbi:hypothetical protein LCGC14_1003060 [marine sediment metagenome]|uniref:DNA polymerase III beta sliding clamp central domain-containing protein n=1 Tax=marine sediment metagenome TaxID=412755 RepID=A0A0F9QKV2_9ZZZZ